MKKKKEITEIKERIRTLEELFYAFLQVVQESFDEMENENARLRRILNEEEPGAPFPFQKIMRRRDSA